MKIQTNNYYIHNNFYPANSSKVSSPVKPSSQSNVSFRGKPWELRPYSVGVPGAGSISADDAIKLYEKLACGNYLDIGEDSRDFANCNKIREKNLEFLDRVTKPEEQKKFIEYYEKVTGFPNLEKVSERIKREFVYAVDYTSRELYEPKFKVLQAGYDGVCSVGRGKAFPGSDLDKAYVIIKGAGYNDGDIDAVNKFRGGIWKNTDQRILSYNHDMAAFPQVYTENQINWLVEYAEMRKRVGVSPQIIAKQEDMMGKYTTDYIAANPYYVRLCEEFPKRNNNYVDILSPSRENIRNLGFTLEAMREGVTFDKFGSLGNQRLERSDTFRLVNLSQLQALKAHKDRKPKRLSRDNLHNEFPTWDLGKQYRFVKTLIKSACANNREFSKEFPQYFSKPGQDLFEPLLKVMMR
ncbi:MAG: hypothetical protein K6E29_01500 [Cyanobacteria bacterium RUI128]|nr:hypothetical protein [Cyanobacteria bacterium RUI128]